MTDPAASRPVALVTGSRKGIGRHLAEHLLSAGYRVIGCGRGAGGWDAEGFEYHQVDVTEEAQVLPLFRHIEVAFGRLDALVNNAALATMNHTLLTPVATVDRLMRTNVTGTFLMSREAAKLMRRRRYGRIVNISSAVVPLRLPGEAVYLASKSAVETLSQVMAKELAELGITVNVVGPGPTATDMTRGVPVGKIDALLGQLSEARFTTMSEIAEAVSYFLQPEHSSVTGQVVHLNGMARG